MIVTSVPVNLTIPESTTPRSLGVHQSAIIRAIAVESLILKPKWVEAIEELSLADTRKITDPEAITRICMGLAWEQWYIPYQLPEVLDHPGEMCIDGIYMTPDGEELETFIFDTTHKLRTRMHEIKFTYKSIRTVGFSHEIYDSAKNPVGPLTDQWMWMAQTKGYCYGANTNYCSLHVAFACGDYSWPMRPAVVRYDIEFTDEELERNWNLLIDYRDYRKSVEGGHVFTA